MSLQAMMMLMDSTCSCYCSKRNIFHVTVISEIVAEVKLSLWKPSDSFVCAVLLWWPWASVTASNSQKYIFIHINMHIFRTDSEVTEWLSQTCPVTRSSLATVGKQLCRLLTLHIWNCSSSYLCSDLSTSVIFMHISCRWPLKLLTRSLCYSCSGGVPVPLHATQSLISLEMFHPAEEINYSQIKSPVIGFREQWCKTLCSLITTDLISVTVLMPEGAGEVD